MPAVQARPFIKWAGGKRQLLPQLMKRLPPAWNNYYEPFLGGGALFFALASAGLVGNGKQAFLSDTNLRLIRTWRAIKGDVGKVITTLRQYAKKTTAEDYYRQRKRNIDCQADHIVAAWFLYINRLGFNGLYRVNRKNEVNVPYGKYANPTVCDAELLKLCSLFLRDAIIYHGPFWQGDPQRGDFVYFDPPYWPVSPTSSFRSFTADGFGHHDQERLRDRALALSKRGVHVMLSNAAVEPVFELYGGPEFLVERVEARRNINSKTTKRGPVGEVIIRSYW